MANNPFDPQIIQIKKTLERGGLAGANRGFGSVRGSNTTSYSAPGPENLSEMSDVDVTGAENGYILVWDEAESTWVASVNEAAIIPGLSKDPRWRVGTGEVSIDEFNDEFLNSAWVKVANSSIPALPSLAQPRYVEKADVLSVKYGVETGVGVGTADGGTGRHCAIVRPLSGAGGSLAVGDAIVTAINPLVRGNTSHRMSGIVLSTTDTSAGNQLYFRWWTGGNTGMRSLSSWSGDTTVGGTDYNHGLQSPPLYMRLVRLSSTTWRGDISPDGVSWIHAASASTWAFEPTHVGFAESNWNTTTSSVVSYEFIRRVSGLS